MGLLRKIFRQCGLPTDRTEEILRRHLDGDFIAFPLAESSASIHELNAIASEFSVVFPEEFAAHVCGRFPGVYVEVKEEHWPRPKALEVGPFWSFLYGLHSFTPSCRSEDWMRLDYVAREFQKGSGHRCVPILQVVNDANFYCIDTNGSIVRYDHETNELFAERDDFWSIFEREVAELKDRKVRKKALQ